MTEHTDGIDLKAPTASQLLAYPRSTISEEYAEAVLPSMPLPLSSRRASLVASVRAMRQRAEDLEDDAVERAKLNAGRRMMTPPPEVDSQTASILIHEHNSIAPDLEAIADSTRRDLNERIEHYAECHGRTLEVAEFLETQRAAPFTIGRKTDDLAHDLRRCGKVLHFHEYDAIGESRLYAGRFCQRWKLCPLCATRRSARMIRAYAPKVAAAVAGGKVMPYLLTMTIANGDDLTERLEHLRASWKKMMLLRMNRRAFLEGKRKRSQRDTEMAAVNSLAYSFEIKRGANSERWHPHLHAVVLCERPMDQEALAQEWKRITGDSHIVDVRPFHCSENLEGLGIDDLVESLAGDLVEVLKYSVKFSSMSIPDTIHTAEVTTDMRLISCVGPLLYGVEVPTSYLDAPLETSDIPFIEVVATYYGGKYHLDRGDRVQLPGRFQASPHCDVPF